LLTADGDDLGVHGVPRGIIHSLRALLHSLLDLMSNELLDFGWLGLQASVRHPGFGIRWNPRIQ